MRSDVITLSLESKLCDKKTPKNEWRKVRGKGLRKVKGGTKVVPEEVGRATSSVAGRTI